MVVLDELHKFPRWKNILKGVADEFGNRHLCLSLGAPASIPFASKVTRLQVASITTIGVDLAFVGAQLKDACELTKVSR